MGMSHAYGTPDDDESIATLEKALEIGINFWDTADVYAHGKNEELVSKVLVPTAARFSLLPNLVFIPAAMES
jgi:aryl-alcohol dehydrogenase-like predicted oxidoreductase